MPEIRRWAVYYAPETGGALARFGADWLGWDAEAGRACDGPEPARLPRSRADLTDAPRKYGFHATLKAPFPLAGGQTPDALEAAVAALARELAPFALPLRLGTLGNFVALLPDGPNPALDALAAACVTRLDGFRGAAAPRPTDGLTPDQRAHLDRWGYPFVLDQFRFHMTLTGPTTALEREAVLAALAPLTAPLLAQPRLCREICLFGETADGMFHILNRFPLTGAPEIAP